MATYPEVREVIADFISAALSGQRQFGLFALKPGMPSGQEFLEDYMATKSFRDLELLKYSGVNALLALNKNQTPTGRFSAMSLPQVRGYVTFAAAMSAKLAPLFCDDDCYTEAEREWAKRVHRIVDSMTERSWASANAMMARSIPSWKTGPV